MEKNFLSKIKFTLMVCVFVLTNFMADLVRPSINNISASELDTRIVGIGKIKSEKIINERNKHGFFVDSKDFRQRMKSIGIGEVVLTRIEKSYRFNE